MITFNNLGVQGRLGNQLFQYALLTAVAIKTKNKIVLPEDLFEKTWHGQKCLLNNFKLPSLNFSSKTDFKIYKEKEWMQFDKNVFEINENIDFDGFFQNINYFYDIKEEVQKEFAMKDCVENKINSILKNFQNTKVSLHVRRGDCSDGTNPDLAKVANDFSNNSLQYQYYDKALKLLPKKSTIFLFTGGSRTKNDYSEDLLWCQKHFEDERIIFINDLTDIESFCFMKNCDINILSFASTFSLWASYLNKSQDCIAPHHFYPHININLNNLFFPNWTVL
jgi:hypothetical protein